MNKGWIKPIFATKKLSNYLFIHIFILVLNTFCQGWMPDTGAKLTNNLNQTSGIRFLGNISHPDNFIVLSQDENSIILGGRNKIYNLSSTEFIERFQAGIEWPSSEAHGQLCILKGKTDDDCQNYIRILVQTAPGKLLICGTNSYKPLCRKYAEIKGKFEIEKEIEAIGVCPYNPETNSTAIFNNGQLYSATVADFSGGDPLIYREPQRTEYSDLKQLNAPNFVSSFPYDDHIFFFYRETAVEYMNCGKIIYSRVARVCKNDKGGPHQSRNRWTTFLKARLNCSIPGEYPFYFDEIQGASEVVNGNYNGVPLRLVYGALTTPDNAIGGSAICVYNMEDILRVFEGNYKHQESINSNWLPLPADSVPEPRPGRCVQDSRVLPDKNVNFIKTHSLMEDAVSAFFGKPILVKVSLQYRFTAIAVDPQVRALGDEAFDILYIGTDDGKVFKAVNIPSEHSAKAVVISENSVFVQTPIKQIKLAPGSGKIIIVARDEAKLTNLVHCGKVDTCSDCVGLQDPHCVWDSIIKKCVTNSQTTSNPGKHLIQDVRRGDINKCNLGNNGFIKNPANRKENEIIKTRLEGEGTLDPLLIDRQDPECNEIDGRCAAVKQRLVDNQTTLHIALFSSILLALLVGFILGFCYSKWRRSSLQYPDAPFIEQHNQLDRLNMSQTAFLHPRPNKTVNLDVNVPSNSPPPKKENLDVTKDLNIASDGTLQKIKKTYI